MSKTKNTELEQNTKSKKSALKRAKAVVWITLAVGTAIAIPVAVFIPSTIGIGLAVFIEIISLVVFSSEMKRVKRNFCKQCGTKYDYETCIEWEVTDVEIKEKKVDHNNRNKQTAGERIEHVSFVCTCENCGHERSFKQKFTTGTLYSDGSISEKNIDTMIKKYFKV